MVRFIITPLFGLFCLVVGLVLGVVFAPQLKTTAPARSIMSIAAKIPLGKGAGKPDENSPYEMYDYPTIKWRPKPLSDAPGAIAQLWTTFEWTDQQHQAGKMNYRLTVFKAPERSQCEVQLLDSQGFKISQFDASDFHLIPGASDIMEARDSKECKEDEYKRVSDYSIK